MTPKPKNSIEDWMHLHKTERNNSELLVIKRQRLKDIVANVPGIVWESWTEPRLSPNKGNYASKHVKKMLGYTVEEWLSKPQFWKTMAHPDDRKKAVEDIEKIFTTRKKGKVEFRIVKKNGKVIHTETNIIVIFDKHDRPVGMRGVTVDITAKKITDQKLDVLNQRFKNILEGIKDGFLAIDHKWKCQYINETAAELFQTKRSILINKNTLPLFKAFKTGLLYKKVREAITTGKIIKFEKHFLSTSKWESISIYPSHEGLSIYFADITERKLAQEKLTLNEKRYRALIENSNDAISVIDPYGCILYASPSTEKLLGYSLKSLIGQNAKTIMHPEDIATADESVILLLKKPGDSTIFRSRYQHKDGSWRWFESIATNLLLDPAIKAIVINYRDVTERVLAEQKKDEFISIASHELRTPVTTLKLNTELLEQEFRDSGNTDAALSMQKMNSQVDKLTNLIGDLLSLSKIHAGKMSLRSTVFDINELIRETARQIMDISPKHRITIRGTARSKIFADREKIYQVVTNLLTNAVKYSPNADKVDIKVGQKSKTIRVSVTDRGIGISKDQSEKIFDKFYQIKNAAGPSFSGLGIGLYIAREIVAKHKGAISLKSTLGKGTTFTVSLPLK